MLPTQNRHKQRRYLSFKARVSFPTGCVLFPFPSEQSASVVAVTGQINPSSAETCPVITVPRNGRNVEEVKGICPRNRGRYNGQGRTRKNVKEHA